MSYIKNISIKVTVGACIRYITNFNKTNEHQYISDSGINFRLANNEWKRVRNSFKKDDGIKAHHFIQSFDPEHGITPEEANKIGKELAEIQFGRMGFDFIVATHIDTGVIHNHILVNNVSRTNGRKYNHDKRTYRFLRQLNIDVCRNNGIEAVDAKLKDINYNDKDIKEYVKNGNDDIKMGKQFTKAPYIKTHAYDSWSEKRAANIVVIRNDINESIKQVGSWHEFLESMYKKGYKIDWQTKSGTDKKYVTYIPDGAERGRRDKILGMDFFSKEAIIRRISVEIEKRKRQQEYENTITNKRDTVQRKIKKEYKQKDNYYLNPNWEERKFCYGKSRYRKRSEVETIIIKAFFKKKLKVNNYKKCIDKFRTNHTIKVDYSMYNKLKGQVNDFAKMKEMIITYHIKNVNEIENILNDYKFKVFIAKEEQQVLKKELVKQENLLELSKIMNAEVKIVKAYDNLIGEEKKKYYYINKTKIHKYNIAKRKMYQLNTNENEVKNKIEKLRGDLEKSQENIDSFEKDTKILLNIKKVIETKRNKEKRIEKNITL